MLRSANQQVDKQAKKRCVNSSADHAATTAGYFPKENYLLNPIFHPKTKKDTLCVSFFVLSIVGGRMVSSPTGVRKTVVVRQKRVTPARGRG